MPTRLQKIADRSHPCVLDRRGWFSVTANRNANRSRFQGSKKVTQPSFVLLARFGHAFLLVSFLHFSLIADEERGISEASVPAQTAQTSVILMPHRKAVLSSEVTARVLKVCKELGQSFSMGETLLVLDAADYQIQKNNAEAVLKAAKANCQSIEELFKEQNASLVEVESARRDLILAEGRVAQAARQLVACTVKAPYAGRVTRVSIDEFEMAEPGTPLIAIVNDQILVARFLLPSNLMPTVKKGMKVEVQVRETGTRVTGTVCLISAVVHAGSRTFEVRAEVDNHLGLLHAGMNGTLILKADEGQARE